MEDYVAVSDFVTLGTFGRGHCFKLVTVDDDIWEDERETLSLHVNLTDEVDRVYLEQDSLEITIVDNDGMFSTESLSVSLYRITCLHHCCDSDDSMFLQVLLCIAACIIILHVLRC